MVTLEEFKGAFSDLFDVVGAHSGEGFGNASGTNYPATPDDKGALSCQVLPRHRRKPVKASCRKVACAALEAKVVKH